MPINAHWPEPWELERVMDQEWDEDARDRLGRTEGKVLLEADAAGAF